MAQPLLVLDHRNGNQQVFRMAGASPSQLGTDLNATPETGAVANDHMASNRVIQFQGEVYAVGIDGVYRFNQGPGNFPSGAPAGDWSNLALDLALPFTNPSLAAGFSLWKFGPFTAVINGVPYLFGAYNTTTSGTNWRGWRLNGNTGVWSETADTVLGYTANNTHSAARCFLYRNVLYCTSNNPAGVLQVLTFDPGAASLGAFTVGGGTAANGSMASFCIFDDRLFCLSRNSGGTSYAIYEFSGGTFVHLFDLTNVVHTAPAGGIYKTCLALNEDGTKMIAFYLNSTGTVGWNAAEIINTAGTISEGTDITTAVVPVAIRHGVGGTSQDERFSVFYDQETTPGSYRTLLYHTQNGTAGTVLTQYLWTNNATLLVAEDTGGSAGFALPENIGPAGGGERIFTQGELHIEIVDRLAVLGGEAVRFKCWGDPGPADKNVEFKRDDENEVPIATATLIGTPTVVSGPGAAPTRLVNVLQGVEADNGATIYETTWDITTDGFVSGQRGQLVPRIYI
jgi:hypothetical protein